MDNDEGLPRPTERHGVFTVAIAHVRDEDYYFDDGNVVFLIDGCLFKVRRLRVLHVSLF